MDNIKELIKNKSRYEKWKKFISRNNLENIFEERSLYEDDSYAEVGFRIANDIIERPMCPCGDRVMFKQNHYQEFCSKSCQAKNNSKRRLSTYKKNTGYSHPHKNPEIRERMKLKMIENYGVEHYMKSPEYVDKVKSTKLKRYGNENYNNIEKIKKTNLERYGAVSILSFQKLKEENMFKKYGVRHSSHLGYNGYRWKDFVMPSGKIVKVQGYENRYLPVLINMFGEDDIIVHSPEIPKVKYHYKDKEHYYFPDFYIPSRNLIIEVKSEYTLKWDLDKNIAKFKAVKEQGFNFKLKVYK
ncbi:HJR family nuclease [Vibrio phage Va1]|nr:HJR family nuclease [Vibrio phage Va1]